MPDISTLEGARELVNTLDWLAPVLVEARLDLGAKSKQAGSHRNFFARRLRAGSDSRLSTLLCASAHLGHNLLDQPLQLLSP